MVSLNNKSFYDHFGGGVETLNGIYFVGNKKQNTNLRMSTKLFAGRREKRRRPPPPPTTKERVENIRICLSDDGGPGKKVIF